MFLHLHGLKSCWLVQKCLSMRVCDWNPASDMSLVDKRKLDELGTGCRHWLNNEAESEFASENVYWQNQQKANKFRIDIGIAPVIPFSVHTTHPINALKASSVN